MDIMSDNPVPQDSLDVQEKNLPNLSEAVDESKAEHVPNESNHHVSEEKPEKPHEVFHGIEEHPNKGDILEASEEKKEEISEKSYESDLKSHVVPQETLEEIRPTEENREKEPVAREEKDLESHEDSEKPHESNVEPHEKSHGLEKAPENDGDDEILDKKPEKSAEFSVQYSTAYGEKICIVGSTEELGNWDLSKATELEWTENNNWKKKISLTSYPFEYKYICVSQNESRWESGNNHIFNGESDVVVDSWQSE